MYVALGTTRHAIIVAERGYVCIIPGTNILWVASGLVAQTSVFFGISTLRESETLHFPPCLSSSITHLTVFLMPLFPSSRIPSISPHALPLPAAVCLRRGVVLAV